MAVIVCQSDSARMLMMRRRSSWIFQNCSSPKYALHSLRCFLFAEFCCAHELLTSLSSVLQLSFDTYSQDGTWVRQLSNCIHSFSLKIEYLQNQVPATAAAVKKIIARIYERTGWEIKELFTEHELADMVDTVVKEPPHMFVIFKQSAQLVELALFSWAH